MRKFHGWLFGLALIVFLGQMYFVFTSDDPIGPVLGAIGMAFVMFGSGWQMRRGTGEDS